MINKLFTIQETADILGVSTKTLRRWDKSGRLIPTRTAGNQRRYTQEQISKLKSQKSKLPTSSGLRGASDNVYPESFHPQPVTYALPPALTQLPSDNFDEKNFNESKQPQKSLPSYEARYQTKGHKASPFTMGLVFTLIAFLFSFSAAIVLTKYNVADNLLLLTSGSGTQNDTLSFVPSDGEQARLAEDSPRSGGAGGESRQAVLQAATGISNLLFNVNIPSTFAEPVTILKTAGIGTNTPDNSAILDLTSEDKGFLAPRMTTAQRDAITDPATSLFVYNTTTDQYNMYNGTQWLAMPTQDNVGTITNVGDVTSGSAFTSTGTQGTSLYFYDPDGRGQVTIANLSAVRTYTLPDATGTFITSGNLTAITTVGTIGTGTWNGAKIGSSYGGTSADLSGATQGSVPYFASTGTMAALAPTTSGYVLSTNGSSANPSWIDPSTLTSASRFDQASGALYPKNSTLDLLIGGTATISAKFAVLNVNSGTPTASLSAGTAGGAFLNATGTLATTARQELILGDSNTGNIVIDSGNAVVRIADLTTNGVIYTSGSNGNLNVEAALDEARGGTGLDTSGVTNGQLLIGNDSANGFTLAALTEGSGITITNAAGSITISQTGSGASKFTQANGTLYPNITTQDLLLGGTASSSAKFAVLNMNSGTPTASVSAGTAGGAFLSATGTLATTAQQTLTLGDANTGEIQLNPDGNLALTARGANLIGAGTLTGLTGLTSSGTITFSGFNANNNALYATVSTGVLSASSTDTANLCFTSGASAPSWVTCPGAGTGGTKWTQSSGLVYPNNATVDLLIGGISTTSAKFSFLNVGAGTPTASVSAGAAGGAYLNATGTLATTVKQTLTLGDANTGNIIINAGSDLITLSDATTANGLITAAAGLTVSSGQNLTLAGITGNNAGLYATASTGVVAGATTDTANLCFTSGASAPSWVTCPGAGTGGTKWTQSSGLVYPNNATVDVLVGGTSTTSAKFAFYNAGAGTPTASISANSGDNATFLTGLGNLAATNMQTLTLGGGTTGNIVIDSGSSSIAFSDSLTLSGTTITASSLTTFTGGATAIDFTEFDVSASTGSITIDDGGNLGNISIEGTILDINSLDFTAGGSIITGGSGDLTLDAGGSNILLSDALNAGGAAAAAYNYFASDISGNSTPDGVADLYIQDELEVDGTIRFNNLTYTFPSSETNTYILQTNGTGTLSWVDPGTLPGSNFFDQANGTLYPKIATQDLLIGGISTASAKFGFINVNSGSPTATISGNLSLTVPTTAAGANTLNLLNNSTLNIQRSPGGDAGLTTGLFIQSNGNVGIGTTGPVSNQLSVGDGNSTTLQTIAITTKDADARIRLEADDDNATSETDNPYILFLQDGEATQGVVGFTGATDTAPDGTTVTGVAANNLYLGNHFDTGAAAISFATRDASANSVKMTIADNGSVGIGDTGPDSLLDILSATTGTDLIITNTNSTDTDVTVGFALSEGTNTFTMGVDDSDGDKFKISTTALGTSDRLIIDSSGNVGISNSTPLTALDVTGSASLSANLSFRGAGTAHTFNILDNGTLNIQRSPGGDAGLATALFVQSNGNVGVGTTTPTEKLRLADGNFLQSITANSSMKVKGSLQDATNLNTAQEVYVSGRYAYVHTGDGRLTILDVSDPTTPVVEGSVSHGDLNDNGENGGLHVVGKYAYVVSNSDLLVVVDVSNVNTPIVVGSLVDNTRLNIASDVYVSGKYAYVSAHEYFVVIDVSDPNNLRIVGEINNTSLSNSEKLYVQGKYAYVAQSNNHSMTIIDISDPTAPSLKSTLQDTTNLNTARGIYVSGKYAYVSSEATDRLTVVDISNPVSPSVAGSVSDATNLDNAHDVYVSGRYAYVSSGYSLTNDGFAVVDISTPASPTVAALMDDAGMNRAFNLFVYGKYVYVTGWDQDRLAIVDIPGLDAPSGNIGNLFASVVKVGENVDIGNSLYVGNGLDIGSGGFFSQGVSAISASTGATLTIRHTGNTTSNQAMIISGNSRVTPADDDAAYLTLQMEDDNNTQSEFARITWQATDVTNSTKDGLIKFSTQVNNTLTDILAINGANVGIGTTTPGLRLDVQDSQSATAAAQIYNTNTGTDADGLIVKLGNTSTTVASSTNHFVSFETFGIGIVGSVQGSGGKGVTYATSGIADFAEYFKKDKSQIIEYGSPVCLNNEGFAVPCDSNNNRVIGIASERPAFLGGENLGEGSIAVGFVGQVLTRVSSANGEIKIGDPLTASSIPGVAVKATSVGQILGKAIEGFNGQSGEIGNILVSVNISWYNPSVFVSYDGTLSGITSAVWDIEKQLALQGEVLHNQLDSSSVQEDFVLANDPLFEGLQDKVSSLELKLSLLSEKMDQNASNSAFLEQITAGEVLGIQASESAQLADILGNVQIDNATVTDNLMVLGRSTVTDLGVTGSINAGIISIHGLNGEINTLGGALYLQKQKLGEVDILDGKIVIDIEGNLKSAGTITAKEVKTEKLTIIPDAAASTDSEAASGSAVLSDSAGSVVIKSRTLFVEVDTTALTSDSLIFATPERAVAVGTKRKDEDTFTISLQEGLSEDIKVSWWVIN